MSGAVCLYAETISSVHYTARFLDADQTHLFASGTSAYINFGDKDPIAAGDQYAVNVNSTELSGYAWGETVGWISLSCQNSGCTSSTTYGVVNDGLGNLSGYAWGETTGWVSFSCANPETNNCGSNNDARVTIDEDGFFHGYAWSENFGWISFNCEDVNECGSYDYRVQTNWATSNSDDDAVSPNSGRRYGSAVDNSFSSILPIRIEQPFSGYSIQTNGDVSASDGISWYSFCTRNPGMCIKGPQALKSQTCQSNPENCIADPDLRTKNPLQIEYENAQADAQKSDQIKAFFAIFVLIIILIFSARTLLSTGL